MANASSAPGVLLVGSVPLASANEVFRTASTILGGRLRRIPDGETGERKDWIVWQFAVLARDPQFEQVPPDPNAYPPAPRVKLVSPRAADRLTLGRLGYADAARASFEEFTELKRAGVIPQACRFQVCLPTPLAPVWAWVAFEDQAIVEPVYEAQLLAELDEIVATIPRGELAIQWDVAVEIMIWEGLVPAPFPNATAGIVDRLARISRHVPSGVDLGFHLCYGDYEHRHFKEPADTSNLVSLSNALSAAIDRPIDWIHMPVPRNRSDDAYFAPLKNLNVAVDTDVYLGLVHMTDGGEGTRRRIAAAQRVLRRFGVATECGLGRRPPATIPDLLRVHAEVTDETGSIRQVVPAA